MALAESTEAIGKAALGLGGKALKLAGPVGQTLGAFAGGPVGAAIGGLAGQFIADRFSPAGKAYREQMQKDISALQQGKLGFSEAEKRGMLAGTQRALQAQTAGVEANLRRQAAAMGGFGRSGAQTNALRGIAAAQGENLAKTAGEIDRLSQQTAENRFANIMGRLSQQRAESQRFGAATGQAAAQTPASIGTYANYVSQARKGELGAGLPSAMGAAAAKAEEERRKMERQMRGQQGEE
jgi:hypothetical protein